MGNLKMAITNITNKSLRSFSLLIFALMLQSTMSVAYTTSGNIEKQFRSVSLKTGAFSAMKSRIADGSFNVEAIDEEYNGSNIFVVYLMWTPKTNMNLCFTTRDDELSPGDQLYIYNTSMGGEFSQPLKIPVYATTDSSKIAIIEAAGNAGSKRMTAVTQMIGKDSGFKTTYDKIQFNKMQMKPWDFEIKSHMADGGAAFLIPPENTHVQSHKDETYNPFLESLTTIQDKFQEVYNPSTETQTNGMEALKSMLIRYGNDLIKFIEEQPFWDTLDQTKTEMQSHYFLPIINGDANIITTAFKGRPSSNMDVEIEGITLLGGVAKYAVLDDKNHLEKFTMLAPINEKIDQLLEDYLRHMKSGATRNDDSVQGLNALYYRIKGAFDGVVTKLKFTLVKFSYNQIEGMYKQFNEYTKLTQEKHTSMNIYDDSKPTFLKLSDFKIFYWLQYFNQPDFFSYSSSTPMLTGGRRRIII